MRHHDIDPPEGIMTRQTPDVRTLAQKALGEVVVRSTPKTPVLCQSLLELLSTALLDPTDDAHCEAVAQMTAAGATIEEIADLYIPESARRIGDLWVSDQCSFVDVTVAASRLQRLLRSTARGFDAAVFLNRPPQRALIIIPEGEQHTLGGALAANQLQRAGISTEIAVGAETNSLRSRIAAAPYALVGISVGSDKSLSRLDAMIEVIVDSRENPPGILLGGWAIDTHPDVIDDLPVALAGTSVAEAIAHLSMPVETAADSVLVDAI